MRATAFVVGPRDGPGATLTDLARSIGFAAVLPFESSAALERHASLTPVCFLLCATVSDVSQLNAVANAVRFSPSRKVRFSPLIYFAEAPSREEIEGCIGFGFDDVVTMPFTPARLRQRLARQIGVPLVYFETADYFGPDRRGRLPAENLPVERRGPATRYRQIEILRTLGKGVSVLRDEVIDPAPV
jgi:CheY-like chemotaxis protein